MRSIINAIKAALRASLSGPGLLGWLIELVKPVAKVLNMASDIDLLVNYFGQVGRFLETGWGTLVSTILGAVIIGYAIYRKMQLQPIVSGGIVGDHSLIGNQSSMESSPIRSETITSVNSPDANLSLMWRNNELHLCVDNRGNADAMFEATVDLSKAGVRGKSGRQYAAVWADDQKATAKSLKDAMILSRSIAMKKIQEKYILRPFTARLGTEIAA